MRTTINAFVFVVIATFIPAVALADILETWESGTENAGVNGDLTWYGDTAAYDVASEVWPSGPDFDGDRSLRSENAVDDIPATVVTRIDSSLRFDKDLTWSVYFSGNTTTFSSNRRADLILMADTNDVNDIEDPGTANGINGYKVTLTDPYANATDNKPPSSHEDTTALGDSLTLWSVDDTDHRWRVVGSVEVSSSSGMADGWNIEVKRSSTGDWYIGYSNGAYGTETGGWNNVGSDTVSMTAFSGTAVYGGVGWLAPDNTETDLDDFGFDNFQLIPEPATLSLIVLAGALLGFRRNFKKA